MPVITDPLRVVIARQSANGRYEGRWPGGDRPVGQLLSGTAGAASSGSLYSASSGLSGGSPSFAWVAPSGLANGNQITVMSNTQTFAQPTKQIYLGFGMGWLYEQADNTLFPLSVTVGSEQWLHESQNAALVGRRVKTEAGIKMLTSTMKPGGAGDPDGAGCLNWDTGGEITPSDVAYLFRRTRCTVGVKTGEFQWKQLRIRPGRDIDNAPVDPPGNECYCPRGNIGQAWQRIDITYGNGSGSGPYRNDKGINNVRLPTDGGVWASFGWAWRPNTVDQFDGMMYTQLTDANRPGFARRQPTPNSDGSTYQCIIQSSSANRPRWLMAQDYVQPTSGSADFVIDSTDYYFKVNGDLFLLANSADLSTVTENPVPLVPVSFNGPSSWTFQLWRGDMTSFAGKYIHRLDALLNPLQVVAL